MRKVGTANVEHRAKVRQMSGAWPLLVVLLLIERTPSSNCFSQFDILCIMHVIFHKKNK